MGESEAQILNYHTPRGEGLWIPRSRYRSVRQLGIAVVVFIAAAICTSLLHFAFMYLQIDLLETIRSGRHVAMATATANDQRIKLTAGLDIFLILVGGILWFVWFYRAYGNVPVLTSEPTRHSQRWSVWAYFIPIVNFWRVPQMMIETFRGSDPMGSSGSAVIVIWWACWIACGIAAQVASGLIQTPPGQRPDLNLMIDGSWTFLVSISLKILAGVLAIFIVGRISKGQAQKYRMLP